MTTGISKNFDEFSKDFSQKQSAKYNYFAFISYAHEDLEVAKYIQYKIEHFPYPEKTPPKNCPDDPEYIRPVFLDKTDLSARPLEDVKKEISEHLSKSRYLIVICSPCSAKPRPGSEIHFVDWEIRQFLESHQNDKNRVFPVLFDGTIDNNNLPDPGILQYLPPAIREDQAKFSNRNLPDFRPDKDELKKNDPNLQQNWDNGVVKIISGLLDLNILDVYDRYSAEQNRIQKLITDQRDRAEGLLRFFIYDLRDEINKYVPTKTRKRIQEKITQYQEAGDDDRQNHDRAAHLANIGDLALVQGNTQEAMDAYQELLEIAKRLSKKNPQNDVWQRDLTVSLDRIGDLYKQQGKTSEAEQAYKESLAVTRRLSAKDTQNDVWQRDLTVSLINIGDLYKQQGKTAEAEQAYKESLAVRRRLSEKDPQNVDWQTDLVVSLFRLHTKANLTEALQILLRLKQQGILPPDKEEWISIIEEKLKNTSI